MGSPWILKFVTCNYLWVTQLSLFTDCPDVAGKWSRPQCHWQVGVHSPPQGVCQGQLPPHPAASETECLNQHPGLTGQHTAVCVNKYLSHTTAWLLAQTYSCSGILWTEKNKNKTLKGSVHLNWKHVFSFSGMQPARFSLLLPWYRNISGSSM